MTCGDDEPAQEIQLDPSSEFRWGQSVASGGATFPNSLIVEDSASCGVVGLGVDVDSCDITPATYTTASAALTINDDLPVQGLNG